MSRLWYLHRPLGRAPRGGIERRESISPTLKRALKTAAWRDCGHRCVYCGTGMPLAEATLDHVVPMARGGRSQPGNLVVACAPCNRRSASPSPRPSKTRSPAR